MRNKTRWFILLLAPLAGLVLLAGCPSNSPSGMDNDSVDTLALEETEKPAEAACPAKTPKGTPARRPKAKSASEDRSYDKCESSDGSASNAGLVASEKEDAEYTDGAMVSKAGFTQALSLIAASKYAEAERSMQALLTPSRRGGSKNQAAEILFWVGYCLEKQGKLTQAEVYYRKVLKQYPSSKAAGQAKLRTNK